MIVLHSISFLIRYSLFNIQYSLVSPREQARIFFSHPVTFLLFFRLENSNLLRKADLEILATIQHEDLVENCKRGNTAAFTELYHLYAKEVYNTIYRLVGHTAEAEDILQESFVAAFQAIQGFEHTGGFRAWIKRIATNKSIDLLRKRKMKFVEVEDGEIHRADDEPVDEKDFVYKVEEVKRAIELLPDTYRAIVELHLFQNIPQVEIARMLGIANNTVRIQYHRAKQKILNTLKQGGVV